MNLFIKTVRSVRGSSGSLNVICLTSQSSSKVFSTGVDTFPQKSLRLMTKKKTKHRISSSAWLLLSIPFAGFGLGTWQIMRKLEKEKLIKELKLRTSAEPVELPQDLTKLEDMLYSPVKVKGTFDHSKEIYMGPRPIIKDQKGHATNSTLLSTSAGGFLVITPFTLSDRDLTILVNRGWVPSKLKNPNARLSGQVSGEVEIVGLLRKTEERAPLGVKNYPEKGIWIYRDLNKMAEVTGAAPIMIDASVSSSQPKGPIGGQTVVSLPDNHLSYLLTWYSLSAITGYMWYKRYWKPRLLK